MMTMTNKFRTAAAMALWPLAMAAQATGMDDDSGDGSMLGFVLAILTAAWLYYKYKKMQRKQAEEQARNSVDLQAMQAKSRVAPLKNSYLEDEDVAEIMRDAERQREQLTERHRHNCPHCGAELEGFDSHCPYCGHELRDMLAEKTVSDLFVAYNEAVTRPQKEQLVCQFKLPDDREGLLEFLALSAPLAKRRNPLTNTKWGRVVLTFAAVFVVLVVGGLFIHSVNGVQLSKAIDEALFMLPVCGGIPAWLVSRRTDTAVAQEHNHFASLWRGRFDECLQKARARLNNADDNATMDRLEREATEPVLTKAINTIF